MLRGLTKSEMRKAANYGTGLHTVYIYQRLKAAGIVTDTTEGWTWARAVADFGGAAETAEAHGIDGKTLRAYIERQGRRSGNPVGPLLHDCGDYLRQLDTMGIHDGELMPQDLQAAHERLSARQRRLLNHDKNRQFRIRRKLYRWMCWRHGKYLIRPIDSADEIIREGEQQHNCVAGYADRHASGQTVICVLRRADTPRTSWHTVELNPATLQVKQCRGFRNASATPEAEEFIEKWTERLQAMKSGRKAV